jgi:hypothetical protein
MPARAAGHVSVPASVTHIESWHPLDRDLLDPAAPRRTVPLVCHAQQPYESPLSTVVRERSQAGGTRLGIRYVVLRPLEARPRCSPGSSRILARESHTSGSMSALRARSTTNGRDQAGSGSTSRALEVRTEERKGDCGWHPCCHSKNCVDAVGLPEREHAHAYS